ncbi:MAG: hypothetical protein WDM89_22310 [Rhizomicrobium sp.]
MDANDAPDGMKLRTGGLSWPFDLPPRHSSKKFLEDENYLRRASITAHLQTPFSVHDATNPVAPEQFFVATRRKIILPANGRTKARLNQFAEGAGNSSTVEQA